MPYYRLAQLLDECWQGTAKHGTDETAELASFGWFAHRVFSLLNWLPIVPAALFAVVGDFEDAVNCWRTQADAGQINPMGFYSAVVRVP